MERKGQIVESGRTVLYPSVIKESLELLLSCQWTKEAIGLMVTNDVSRGDACGSQSVSKQVLKSCQIGRTTGVGCITAEDHHLGGSAYGEDVVHNGGKNTRIDLIGE